jgi:hypothetical protein
MKIFSPAKDKKKKDELAVSILEIPGIPSNVPQKMTVCQCISWDVPGQKKPARLYTLRVCWTSWDVLGTKIGAT